jgi:carbon monoxide dehydrogenase subunit G
MRRSPFTSISLLIGTAGLAALLALGHTPARAADEDNWFSRLQAEAGSGSAATEARSVPAFQAIATAGDIHLKVRQAAREAVEVRTDDNLLPLLETVVEPEGDTATLKVRWKRGVNVRPRTETIVTVDVVTLRAIASSGSGRVTVEPLSTPSLKLSLSGSGDARLSGLQAGEFVVSIAGSGDVRGDGKADRLRLSIAGSGDVKLADLRADEVSVSIAGSGDAAVNAQKTLKVSIAGSGDVTYTGDAAVSSSIAGSGHVRKK